MISERSSLFLPGGVVVFSYAKLRIHLFAQLIIQFKERIVRVIDVHLIS